MILFRIAKCHYIKDLSGAGARVHGGRWNSKGNAVLYTAGSRSLATLEALVHIPQKNMTDDFCILILKVPEEVSIKSIQVKTLPADWQKIPLQPALQEIGDQWLSKGKYAIMRVPSVVVRGEYNYLVNPLHPDAKRIRIEKTEDFVFDERISRRIK